MDLKIPYNPLLATSILHEKKKNAQKNEKKRDNAEHIYATTIYSGPYYVRG